MVTPRSLQSDFAPEWCAVAALVALDAGWARAIHFRLIVTWHDAVLLAAALAVTLALRLLAIRKGGMTGEYFSLTLAATSAFGVMSYLALASSGPLVDARLQAIDQALGFDWQAGHQFLRGHLVPRKILQFAYDSLVYQGLYFCVLLGLTDRRRDMREMFWLVFLAGLFTSAGAMLFPALGPFKLYNAAPAGSFLPEMEHLRSGRNLSFALGHMTGVVSFPSFHTTMALAYGWGFRRTGPIGWIIAGLNLLMLCAIPWFGGHYLTDMIAGAGVMLASLGLVKGYAKWKARAASASPQYAQGATAGA